MTTDMSERERMETLVRLIKRRDKYMYHARRVIQGEYGNTDHSRYLCKCRVKIAREANRQAVRIWFGRDKQING